MIKFFLLFLFINTLSCKIITSEVLTLIKQHNSLFIDNPVFNFLSGLFNDSLLISSKEMTQCFINYTKVRDNLESFNKILELFVLEATTLVQSNIYSHLNHKFKKCDINNDTSQKLSIYFIDKFRGLFRNFILFPTLNTARQLLLCYKKATNIKYPNIVDEFFFNIDKYISGYPETFCQIKQLEEFIFSIKMKSYDEKRKYFNIGLLFSDFLKILMQHKRKCVNNYFDKNLIMSYIGITK